MLRLDPISIQFEPSDRGLASPPASVLKCPLGRTAAPPSNLAPSTRCQWPALEESLSETHPYPMWANWLRDLAANGQPPFFPWPCQASSESSHGSPNNSTAVALAWAWKCNSFSMKGWKPTWKRVPTTPGATAPR